MDWSFIGEHLPLYAEAAQITLTISFFGVFFSPDFNLDTAKELTQNLNFDGQMLADKGSTE